MFTGRFLRGDLRTLPSEWFGWTPWDGLALYVVIASATSFALVAAVRSPR